MTLSPVRLTPPLPPIRWEKLPEDFPLPDEPVESTLQPLLAAALREALELAQMIPAQALIASNFGLCSTVGDKVVVKAPRLGLCARSTADSRRRDPPQLYPPPRRGIPRRL
jgi:hypothetical protein